MITEKVAEELVAHAHRYWTLANVLTGFYFAQALAFWYKLGEKELAGKLRPIVPWIVAILWVQMACVGVLIYGSYLAEWKLLGSKTNSLTQTSAWACYAQLFIIVGMTALSTLIVLLTTGRLKRTP